jgi:CheY-like chemotaxis protein
MVAVVVSVDPSSLRTQQRALEEAGFDVLPASTFQEGAEKVAHAKPDLLVTDVRLQDYNGIHLVIRAQFQSPHTRAVVVGYPDRSLERDAADAGALYLDRSDVEVVVEAARRVFDDRARHRRWHRVRVEGRIEAFVDKLPVSLIDISEGGFRMEAPRDPVYVVSRTFYIHLPGPYLTTRARSVWILPGEGSGDAVCGAWVEADKNSTITPWKLFVAAVAAEVR